MGIPLEIYQGETKEKRKLPLPKLALNQFGQTVAVNDDGETLATLWGPSCFRGKGSECFSGAQWKLENKGFDTSFAEWNGMGAFVCFKYPEPARGFC